MIAQSQNTLPAGVDEDFDGDFVEIDPSEEVEYFGEDDIDGSWNLMSSSEHSTLYRGGAL